MATSPQRRVEQGEILVDQLDGRLHRGMVRAVEDRRRALAALAACLTACSHQQVLNRGFTITRLAPRGKIVRQASDAREGDRLLTETADGDIASRVVDERQGELFE
jgi:exodeoxyribonuclease VII large subunit